ncbi:MAG TPA: hypothetical protein V6C58_07365 [Allocoleopsis sp.]
MAQLHICDDSEGKLIAYPISDEKMDISIYTSQGEEEEYRGCIYLTKDEAAALVSFIKQQFNL